MGPEAGELALAGMQRPAAVACRHGWPQDVALSPAASWSSTRWQVAHVMSTPLTSMITCTVGQCGARVRCTRRAQRNAWAYADTQLARVTLWQHGEGGVGGGGEG